MILAMPVILVACMELLFRLGAWEPIAEPRSHAGLSVRLKHYLESPTLERIDFVTLGSSRPQHGIDHEQLAALAAAHGKLHVNMSLPGMHWMSVGVIGDWLRRQHPEIRGGIIALTVQDFSAVGNGRYELEIIQPFRKFGDQEWVEAHVPFDADKFETWGSRSSLIAWREDIQHFIRNPIKRLNRARKVARRPDPEKLFGNQTLDGTMCDGTSNALVSCETLEASVNPDPGKIEHCAQIRYWLANRPHFSGLPQQEVLPEPYKSIRDLVRAQLREIKWEIPPVVVLMPLLPTFRSGIEGEALHQWALQVLQPLQDDGTIHIIDATTFFDAEPGHGCAQFADFYHQNADGRRAFTDWLIPQIEVMLYAAGPR